MLHFPMLCGIIVIAAATEAALALPEAPLAADMRAALGAGSIVIDVVEHRSAQ